MGSLREQLEAIYATRGELNAAVVVEEARPDDHPLHTRFEWDDAVAGEAYRRVQAGELIRSVRVKYTTGPDSPIKDVRAFIATHGENETTFTYEPIVDVIADDFKRRLMTQSFERDWKQFKARYDSLTEFTALIIADLQETAA